MKLIATTKQFNRKDNLWKNICDCEHQLLKLFACQTKDVDIITNKEIKALQQK